MSEINGLDFTCQFIYGVYDKKAPGYKMLFLADNDDLAKRVMYRVLSGDRSSDMVLYPYDFAVYRLGSFILDTGAIHNFDMKDIAFELISLFSNSVDNVVDDVKKKDGE